MTDKQVLYLVRHGETDSNLERRYAGWSDDPLNDTGRRQASALAALVGDLGVRRIYTSPVRRAAETASILAEPLSASVHTVHDLREIELGPWKGYTDEEVAELYPEEYRQWQESPETLVVNGRETLADLTSRSVDAANLIGRAGLDEPERSVLVVTHMAVIRALLMAASSRPLSAYHAIGVSNAGAHPVIWNGPGELSEGGDPILPNGDALPADGGAR